MLRCLVVLALLAAAAGCDKTNDVPRLQDQAIALAQGYQQRFDDLARRVERLRVRANALPRKLSTAPEVNKAFLQASSRIEDARRSLGTLPDEVKKVKPEDLQKAIDGLREGADRAVTEATSNLAAVESWVWITEQQPAGPAADEPPAEPRPEGEGSAAPIR